MKKWKLYSIFILLIFASFHVWARGGGGCFEQGTPVETLQGTQSIETLHPGDWIWSNIQGQHQKTQIIAITKIIPENYLELKFENAILHVTKEHLFAIKQGVFKNAAQLQIGDEVLSWNHDHWDKKRVLASQIIQNSTPAFNLLVSRGGTYFANHILVHNKGCFLPDTPILRADGTSIAISQVKPGDSVKAFNSQGSVLNSTVKNILTLQTDSYYIVVTPNTVLNVTAEHPFFVGNGTFKTVEVLVPGDVIFAVDDNQLKPQVIKQITQVKAVTTVYNLQTDEPHTYFAAGIAVHNKGGGCFPAKTKIETPKGDVPIELLAPGDMILTYDENGKKIVTQVESTFAKQAEIIIIKTNQGILQTTSEHPLAISASHFEKAGEVVPQTAILFAKQGKLVSAVIQSIEKAPTALVFNLQVGPPHTFIADGFLVHNKGGGGYSGRSSSGGSGGGSSCKPDDIFCKIMNWIFVPVFLLFWILGFFKGEKDNNLDYIYSPSQIKPKAEKTLKLLNFLAKQDLMMLPKNLEETTRKVFLKLQECWEKRDYTPMKELMMPDLFIQHNRQIAGMIRNHEINRLNHLHIISITLVNVRYTEIKNQREFTALITASATDFYIDDRTEKFIRGDTVPSQFQEFWTFQLQNDQWLLREIEQAGESSILKEENFFEQFTDKQVEKVYQGTVDELGAAGPWVPTSILEKTTKVERMLNFLARDDKMWDRQSILNRVRDVFNNLHMALESGELSPTVATQLYPAVAEACRQSLAEQKSSNETIEYRNFCIRKVEILLVRNFNDKSQDEFVARISAHAQKIHRKGDAILSKDADVTAFEEYWTFGRLDGEWKLKEALPKAKGEKTIATENTEEDSPDLVKWYYTKKRAL